MKTQWKQILKKNVVKNWERICSEHFENKCIYIRGKCKNLTANAIPTIFAPVSAVAVSRDSLEDINMGFPHEALNGESCLSSSSDSVTTIIPDTEQETIIPPIMSSGGSSTVIEDMDQIYASGYKHIKEVKQNKKITIKTSLITSTSGDSSSPKKNYRRKIKLRLLRSSYKEMKQKERRSKEIIRRRNRKITQLENVLKNLRSQNLLQEEHLIELLSMSEPVKELLKRQLRKSLEKSYPIEIRTFAMNLNFYSPKGYDYVRKTFGCLLPHPKTIAKWYTCVNGKPGFTEESFHTLRLLVNNERLNSQNSFCNIVFDEIYIRSQVEWDGKCSVGCVDLGDGQERDQLATQILVFMAVGINKRWKLPLGYFPIASINGAQKHNLLHLCLHNLFATGVKIIGVTFDGCPVNMSVGNLLGCKANVAKCTELNSLDPKFTFKVESVNKQLVILPDPCHMLKLIRNTFAEKGPLMDGNGEKISWHYLEDLLKLQESEQLHLGNKLRLAHVYFKNQKMNVRLATQALSNSVADALIFCRDQLGLPQFLGCLPTVKFIRTINDTFDILSSRCMTQRGLKQPLCEANIEQIEKFVNSAVNYLGSLQIKTLNSFQPVVMSPRKTGFIGMILCLKSINFIFNFYIRTKLLKFIPFYKLNQDHLELFFASIRSRLGSNNNPTVRQFTAAYKRLLVHTQISDTGLGNCLPLEELRILNPLTAINLTTDRSLLLQPNTDMTDNDKDFTEDETTFLSGNADLFDYSDLSEFVENVVEYIAGFIVFRLKKSLYCSECILYLERTSSTNSLISHKNRGGLKIPNLDIVLICNITEKEIRLSIIQNNYNKISLLKESVSSKIIINVQSKLLNRNLFSNLPYHIHYNLLIKCIIKKYLDIRLFYISSNTKKNINLRNKFNRLVIFQGM